jgi:hypothetical protein
MIKVTSYTSFMAAEGLRLSYTYSEIDENGNIIKSNIRKDMVVMDEDLKKELNDVFTFLTNREAATE